MIGRKEGFSPEKVRAQVLKTEYLWEYELLPNVYSFYECDAPAVEQTSTPSAIGLSPETAAVSGVGLFSAIGAVSQLPYVCDGAYFLYWIQSLVLLFKTSEIRLKINDINVHNFIIS